MTPVGLALVFAAAYLIGAVPVGLIVARLHGVDIRKHGSGNVGATNVGRALGRKWGVLVFILDLVKGALVSIAAPWSIIRLSGDTGGLSVTQQDWVWLGAGALCIVGNTASVFLRFRGGKGVATSLGVILGIWPFLSIAGLAAFAVWAIVVRASRYVSLASITAAVSLPVAFLAAAWIGGWSVRAHLPLLLLCLLLTGTVVVRHRENIRRLAAGTENRIGVRGPSKES